MNDRQRAELLYCLCMRVIEVHEQVRMDTDEDRALHARAIAVFRTALLVLQPARNE